MTSFNFFNKALQKLLHKSPQKSKEVQKAPQKPPKPFPDNNAVLQNANAQSEKNPDDDLIYQLKNLPTKKRTDKVIQQDSEGDPILFSMIDNPQILESVLILLDKKRLSYVYEQKDKLGNTILHLAAMKPDTMTVLLNYLPKEEHLSALEHINDQGYCVFDIFEDMQNQHDDHYTAALAEHHNKKPVSKL